MEIKEITERVQKVSKELDETAQRLIDEKKELSIKLSEISEGFQMLNFNSEKVKDFWDQPYAIIPRAHRVNEWYVIAPSFVDFHIGWLEKSVKGWNYFIVNQYATWLSDVPKELREKFNFKEPLVLTVAGNTVTTKDPATKEKVLKTYKRFVHDDKTSVSDVKIKKGYEFKLIAEMIADGIMPFTPKKVMTKDANVGFELRDYQLDAWNRFTGLGAVGIYWPYGAGKTFFGLWALAHISGRKLIVVPTKTLKEQWSEHLTKNSLWDDTEVITYMGYPKVKKNEYALIVFDECHRLPANTFVRLATLRTQYRIGLSSTPYREDNRTNFIFALTGFPIGMDWDKLLKAHIVNKPTITLYIVGNETEKIKKVMELLDERKTLIYSYWLGLGEKIANKLNVPFVFAGTNNRLSVLKENNVCVMSSVGGEGVSIPELERIIEVGFLYGSRREEGQLMGRLFHSQMKDPEHTIIMSEQEYKNFDKRLNAIYEKGFRIRVVR